MNRFMNMIVGLSFLTAAGACDSADTVESNRMAGNVLTASATTMTPEEEIALKLEAALVRLRALEEALTEETAARKAADEALSQRVTELETGMVSLREALKSEISRLDAALAATNQRIDDLEASLERKILEAKADLSGQIADLALDTSARLDALNLKIEGETAALERTIAEAKQHAAQTYATKAEMESLNVLSSRLEANVALLDQRISDNELADEALAELVDQKFLSQAADFKAEISRLDAKDSGFAQELRQIVTDTTEKIAEESAKAKYQAQMILEKVGKVEAYNLDSHAKIQTEFQVLKVAIAGLSYSNSELRDSLNAKYAELSDADKTQKEEFQNAIVGAIKTEQDARMELNRAMEAIKKRIEDIAAVANAANKLSGQGIAMAKANETALNSLAADTRAQIRALESAFDDSIRSLAQRTEVAFASLDARYQRQAGELTARLADAELRLDQLTRSLSSILNQIPDMPSDAVLVFDSQTQEKRDNLIRTASEMAEGIGLFEAYFLDAINYLDETSAPNPEIARRFGIRVVSSGMCPDSQGPTSNSELGTMEQASAGGYQWYRHLSAAYMREVFFGPRTASTDGDIYLGLNRVEITSLGGYALMASLPDYFDSISTPSCKQAINDWARSIIFGTATEDPIASEFRNRMTSRALTSFVQSELSTRLGKLLAAANEYQNALTNFVALRIANADLRVLLFGQDDSGSTLGMGGIIPRLAFILGELSEAQRNQVRLSIEFENMKTVLATHAVAQRRNSEEIRTLGSTVDGLRNDIRRIKEEHSGQINNLASALRQSLSLISVLANQVGRADVALAAVAISRTVNTNDDGSQTTGTGGLKSVRFAFPYISKGNDQQLSECAGPVIAAGANTLVGGTPDCAGIKIAGNSAPVVINRNGRTWYTFPTYSSLCERYVQIFARLPQGNAYDICSLAGGGSTGANTTNLASIQGGALQIEARTPWDTTAKRRHQNSRHGQPVPSDRLVESNFVLAVGDSRQAEYFKFWSGIALEPYFIVSSQDFSRTIKGGIAYYEVPASFVFSKTPQGFWKTAHVTSLTTQPATGENNEGKVDLLETGTVQYTLAANDLTLYTYSPIVVNLDTASMPRTTRWVEENVRFDLNGDGKMEQVGWVAPGSYLLAVDLNENGKIDDGRELFGTATRLPNGLRAEHGYRALQQYDDNHDGVIDGQDRIFTKLVLWGDQDQNGISSPEELQSLTSAKVTKLSVTATSVTGADSITHEGSTGNRIYYKSKAYGPEACGQTGCETFDVWFNFVPLSEPRMAGR